MCEPFVEENHHSRFDFPQVYQAYLDCRRNKRGSRSALEFEMDYEEKLLDLVAELREGRYRPGASICFYTQKPKCREIFAAAFRDRIVHHLVYNQIAPLWEKIFIHQSFACRVNKGTHAAASVLQGYLRKAAANGRRRAWYLKMDIHNFFMSIDRQILFDMLAAKCPDTELQELLALIVFHDPTENYELQDRDCLRELLPPHKSLFHTRPGCGLPIGNLTSQFFANVYLNRLDQFVKHELKCRFYMRYVDDFVLIDREPAKLRQWRLSIENFLRSELALSVNERATRIAPVSGGVDFVGFVVRQDYKLVRRRVIGNLKAKLRKTERELVARRGNLVAYRFDPEILDSCLATVNAYLGHFRHAQTLQCRQKIWRQFPFLSFYFRISSHKLARVDKPLREMSSFKDQVYWLKWKYPQYICLIQIGSYFEAFNTDAKKLAVILGLKLNRKWRGFFYGCGFPKRFLGKATRELESRRIPYLVVRETGRELYRAKERLPQLAVEYKEER